MRVVRPGRRTPQGGLKSVLGRSADDFSWMVASGSDACVGSMKMLKGCQSLPACRGLGCCICGGLKPFWSRHGDQAARQAGFQPLEGVFTGLSSLVDVNLGLRVGAVVSWCAALGW